MLEVAEIIRLHGVVHCQHAGRGQKVLDYLGRYIFRVAIANSSLERIQDGQVTFRYRDNQTQHVAALRANGKANADFMGALAHRIRDHAVEADGRQRQSQQRKTAE